MSDTKYNQVISLSGQLLVLGPFHLPPLSTSALLLHHQHTKSKDRFDLNCLIYVIILGLDFRNQTQVDFQNSEVNDLKIWLIVNMYASHYYWNPSFWSVTLHCYSLTLVPDGEVGWFWCDVWLVGWWGGGKGRQKPFIYWSYGCLCIIFLEEVWPRHYLSGRVCTLDAAASFYTATKLSISSLSHLKCSTYLVQMQYR